MIIGDRLRLLREQKNLSQGDIEKRLRRPSPACGHIRTYDEDELEIH